MRRDTIMVRDEHEVVFTSVAVLDLLLQIDELKDYDIGLSETEDGNLQLQIGTSTYIINNDDTSVISVDDEVVDEISETAEDAYEDLLSDTAELSEVSIDDTADDIPIEGGLLKDVAKSLLLGGMIRFAKKHLL